MLKMNEHPNSNGFSIYDSYTYGKIVASEEGGALFIIEDSDGVWRLPLIARPIPGSEKYDAVSPYGYAGFFISDQLGRNEISEYWRKTTKLLAQKGIVSLFLRFPPFFQKQALQMHQLEGLEVRKIADTILVPLNTEEIMWANMHRRSRTAVRAAEKANCKAEVIKATPQSVAETRRLYESTMSRVGAADKYIFSDNYYDQLLGLKENIQIARVTDGLGNCVAASFILTDSKFAHYHLSGSTGTVSGANNLLLWTVMKWAYGSGLEAFHLGGGLSDGDSLYKFKSSFGNNPVPFSAGQAVIDHQAYSELVTQRAKQLNISLEDLESSGFFPAYRSDGVE